MIDKKLQQRFATLWHEHRGIAFKVASIYARGSEDRHDLVQDIGMQLWRSFPVFDARRAKFSTWMYRIALNVAISHTRRHYRTLVEHSEPLDEIHLETIDGGAAVAEPDERLDMLYAVIAQLDELDRALMLLYLEDRSYSEMAQILGISETNVATKLSRIKQKLRRQVTAGVTTPTGA